MFSVTDDRRAALGLPAIKSDDELLNDITDLLLKNNPHLSRGDRLTSVVELVSGGKILADSEDDSHIAMARSLKVFLPLTDDKKILFSQLDGKFLHPYMCTKNQIFEKILAGEKLFQVIDPETYEPIEIPITEELIK